MQTSDHRQSLEMINAKISPAATTRPLKTMIGLIAADTFTRPGFLKAAAFHIYTIWLFTASDMKTIVGPKTIFGTMSAISAPVFKLQALPLPSMLGRVPSVAFWCWINLLPFAIDNQRQIEAVREDALNKPWRPLPSGRLSATQAMHLMLVLYPIAIAASFRLGGLNQSIMLIFLGYWYNDCGGADKNCILRNTINGAGFICYTSGAMEVAYRSPIRFTMPLVQWFVIIGVVVSTTVHTQDMYDQAGDSARHRRTVPLVVGDLKSRWTIAVSVIFWSWFCPWFWGDRYGYIAPILLGTAITHRTLARTSVKEDKNTFKLWNLWMVALYSLPLLHFIHRTI